MPEMAIILEYRHQSVCLAPGYREESGTEPTFDDRWSNNWF